MSKLILVIDDSALMRKHLKDMLTNAGFKVQTARNGEEGLEKLEALTPDAITLDVNMPVMDGITCLSMIMEKQPTPVIMVSSITEKGALATFEALELGAVDYIPKPGGTVSLNLQEIEDDLINKVRSATQAQLKKMKNSQGGLERKAHTAAPSLNVADSLKSEDREKIRVLADQCELTRAKKSQAYRDSTDPLLVIIGVSTGGPNTIEKMILEMPKDFPIPVLILQHMPAKFTKVFSDRLDKLTPLSVLELKEPTELAPGCIYIAQGEADVKFTCRAGRKMAISVPIDKSYTWHPSVEKAVETATEVFDPNALICVQLTGMGDDGAKAMADAYKKGARTIAESEESAVVFGMSRALIELNGAECVLPSDKIMAQISEWI